MGEKQYTIDDLCELTGYSRRTIRYYIQEGLVDPPAGRGRGGFYFDSHLKRLVEIKSLQDKGLRLSAIFEFLKKGNEPKLLTERELWIRYRLDQGIELHISRDLEEKERKKIIEIIRIARTMLESGGEKDE
ncbi:Transcriptional regulator, MerR family [uncultured Desulfobacterium sp.]|uniref:Transcriptional regulator, MerR family n=1 Tax=uncultured Desulfobacterium sp. TaxID=201089 RepID=A0A445MZE9_9BACT|nr:Transcriptional regulator, MerR family [uncultured Desulfobacterium sp.]